MIYLSKLGESGTGSPVRNVFEKHSGLSWIFFVRNTALMGSVGNVACFLEYWSHTGYCRPDSTPVNPHGSLTLDWFDLQNDEKFVKLQSYFSAINRNKMCQKSSDSGVSARVLFLDTWF